MKILIGMTRSDTMASGSFKHIVQIGERFRKEGVTVAYAIGKTGPASEYLKERDFKVYEMPQLERELNVFKDLMSLLHLIAIIVHFRPGVCSWHTAKIGALGRIASFFTFRKNYYVPHGIPFYESQYNKGYQKYRKLEKLLSVLPATIIGVCDYDTEQYLRLGIPEKKTLTIHNGMRAMAERSVKATEKEKTIFVTAARFEDQKDYATLAQAVKMLAQHSANFELHIYGDGQHEDDVKALFADIDGPVVRFAGVIDDLTIELRKADVFVLSSHWEGLPRTIIEAMSCAMPVIATAVGGVGELIDHGRSGYLVQPSDYRQMSHCMQEYVDEPALIAEHGLISYRKFKAGFTLDKMLAQYVSEYMPPAVVESKPIAESVTDA